MQTQEGRELFILLSHGSQAERFCFGAQNKLSTKYSQDLSEQLQDFIIRSLSKNDLLPFIA